MLSDSVRGLRAVFGAPRIRVLLALWWVPPVFAVAPEALAARTRTVSSGGRSASAC
jgi:hypothetical protein